MLRWGEGGEAADECLPHLCDLRKGPKAAAERLAKTRISGKRPVEILPRDFTTRLTEKAAALRGSAQLPQPPHQGQTDGRESLGDHARLRRQEIELAAGETRTLTFPVKEARPQESGAYPFKFNFTSDAGNAEYREALNCAVVPKATITVDGNLGEWKDIPSVTVLGKDDSVDSIEVLRRPWLALKEAHPGLVSGRLKMAWDEDNLYICAEVNDPTQQKNAVPMEGRDENSYFHRRASDEREPYKSWLANCARSKLCRSAIRLCRQS